MQYVGIIIHHSVCPSVNGRGFDFFISKEASVIPSTSRTDPNYIHICLEGDFSRTTVLQPTQVEQLFVLGKLRIHLSEIYGFAQDDVFPHTGTCPGSGFPWSRLVISLKDGYH